MGNFVRSLYRRLAARRRMSPRRSASPYLVWLLPLFTLATGLYPHASKASTHLAKAHGAWYDALTHMYQCWESWRSLTLQHGLFDFRWFYPYPISGTYDELHFVPGLLYGIFDLFVASEALAFNLAMVGVLVLNLVAAYFLLRRLAPNPWVAMIFAHAVAFSPFAWTRYAHPSNTVIFCGVLGLLFLRLATETGRWRWCLLAPPMFVLQFYSGLYVGMFFVFVLMLYIPWALARARAHRVFLRTTARLALASALALPALGYLYQSYSAYDDQYRQPRTFEYVSGKSRKNLKHFANDRPLDCDLRILGKRAKWTDCRVEMHPGRLASWGGTIGLLVAIVVAARRRSDAWWRSALRWGAVLIGYRLALHWEETLPFHLGLWFALAVPGRKRGDAVGLRSEAALPLACVLLLADVAVNPTLDFPGVSLKSIFEYFFEYVPGMSGLRSEYRAVVLLPLFLAMIGAWGTGYLLEKMRRARLHLSSTALLTALAALAVVSSQPGWQLYTEVLTSARLPQPLRAARALPDEAILSVIGASGTRIRVRRHYEDAYTMGAIMFHEHRQVSGRVTRKTPGSLAIRFTQSLGNDALLWSARVSQLFGASHLLIDWGSRKAPNRARVESMLREVEGLKLLELDRRLALVEMAPMPGIARGPVADVPPPGKMVRPDGADASVRPRHAKEAIDDDPWSAWETARGQREGDWIAVSFRAPLRLNGLAFTPMNETASIPTQFAIDVRDGGEWREVARKERWEVPWSLIRRGIHGRVVVPFEPTQTTAVRLRLLATSPWKLHISDVVAFTPSDE